MKYYLVKKPLPYIPSWAKLEVDTKNNFITIYKSGKILRSWYINELIEIWYLYINLDNKYFFKKIKHLYDS